MQIRVAGYLPASFLLERESGQWPALVILDSAADVAADFLAAHATSHCVLRFDDVLEDRGKRRAPSREWIKRGLDFARGKERLLVSCRAGQARSAALAYVIGCREHGAAEAIRFLDPTRHRPNRLVVELGAGLVDAPGLLGRFEEWCDRHAHIKLSDYYDEIEKEIVALEAQGACNRICPL